MMMILLVALNVGFTLHNLTMNPSEWASEAAAGNAFVAGWCAAFAFVRWCGR